MTNNNGDVPQFKCCFEDWIVQQNEDLKQLIVAKKEDSNNDEKLHFLVEMSIKRFDEYHEKRLGYAQSKASSFFSPSWCSSFENSFLWVAGCRPSLFIRLLYTLCGLNLESHLSDFLDGERTGRLCDLSAEQLALVDELQRKTIKCEDEISSNVASKQEEMADDVLVNMSSSYGVQLTNLDHDLIGILDSFEGSWVDMLEKADNLRLQTLKEIVKILTPLQAVEFLIGGKRLHLSIHQWCKQGRI